MSSTGPAELSALFQLRPVPVRKQPVWDANGNRVDPYKRERPKLPSSKRHVRDAQRTRLYAAENAAFHLMQMPDPLDTLEDAAALVERIRSSRWMKTNYPRVALSPVKVIGGNGCNATTSRIMLTSYGRARSWVVIHELCHVIEGRHYLYQNVQWHGREFCNIYLATVRRWLGEDAYSRLRAEMKARKVKHCLGRKVLRAHPVKRPGNTAALEAYRARKAAERTALLASVKAATLPTPTN